MEKMLIAKIKKIYNLNTKNNDPVFRGYIPGYKEISLESIKEKGLSCNNCIFNENGMCISLPHKQVSENEGILNFSNSDFKPDRKNEHLCDDRLICEFYRFRPVHSKENEIRKWYENEGDEDFWRFLPTKFSQFSEETEMRLESKCKENERISNDLIKTKEKLLELEDFVKFFRDEIPGVYKSVKSKFRKVKEYD